MRTVVGILDSVEQARALGNRLRAIGISEGCINLLTPDDEKEFAGVTTTRNSLRHGRTVVITFVNDEASVEGVREVLRAASAESIDATPGNWGLGSRDSDQNFYSNDLEEAERRQKRYCRGFETALHPAIGRRPYAEAVKSLSAMFPTEYADESFRLGYRSGYIHYRELISDR